MIGNKLLQKILFICFLFVTGCNNILSDTNFPVTIDGQNSIQNNMLNIIQLTPKNINQFNQSNLIKKPLHSVPKTTQWNYTVGIGDRLAINVWDHPELNQIGNFNNEENLSGFVVNTEGKIFYPYIENIFVLGMSASQIQKVITSELSEYITNPQVDVKIVSFNSKKVQVTGAVKNPQSISLNNIPLFLMDAVNASQGLALGADSSKVTLQRNGKIHGIDLKSYIENGRVDANPILRDGDVVNIPIEKKSLAFIMGEIRKPGTIELDDEGINLTEAISSRGGLEKNTANAQGIFVFRDNKKDNKLNVFQLDATTPLAFVLATNFYLQEQDVVYIVQDPVARWNALLDKLLPSVLSTRSIQETVGGF